MTTGALATMPESKPLDASAVETVLIKGDLSKLNEVQRVNYYRAVCESVGLNPLTQPFAYINLNGKLRLYALKDATDQLRKIHGVSVQKLEKERQGDLYIVTAYVADKSGRTDASTGAVDLKGKRGDDLANALMKAETKAKRRATLSICGLGMLDETEAADITQPVPASVVEAPLDTTPDGETVNAVTGEVVADDGLLRVVKVESRPTQTNKPRWLITFSDGLEAWTFRQQLSSLAEQLAQESAVVERKATDKGKWGWDLDELRRAPVEAEMDAVHPAPLDDAPPLSADDIPF